MSYPLHDLESAPSDARPVLAEAKAAFGFVPNLMAVMASAPPLLKAYLELKDLFEETSFTPTEQQIVLLAASSANQCEYCVAAHTVIAGMQKVPAGVVDAIRDGRPIADARLEALRRFAADVAATRGRPAAERLRQFLDAGYTEIQVLEVILGVGFKTLSNYTNHVAGTPLDQAFSRAAWTRAA